MIQQKRYEHIAEMVNAMGIVDLDTLCAALGVSRGTVRRDLISMEQSGFLRRTRGGAQSIDRRPDDDLPIRMRRHLYSEQKERIAQSALDCVHEGDTLLLGAGTTVLALAGKLSAFSNLTIVTYDIGIAYEIAGNTGHALLMAGGAVKKHTFTLTGGFTEAFLRDTRIDCAFFSADALDADSGFMDCNAEEITLKRVGMQNALRKVMLLDQSKLGVRALMTICGAGDADLTIVDGPLSEARQRILDQSGAVFRVA